MKKWAYYNENDPEKAEAIRWLIREGWAAPGEVDERDIRDVAPVDVNSFAQCHWFGGIALWSVAARRAGIPDDFPFWSGSCPCQPFSAAGAGDGIADDRHLWPHWFWLIAQCIPHAVVGEQVSSSDGLAWLSLVSTDMEGADYAGGALDLCSPCVGAPNIRQRLFMCWLAGPLGEGCERGAGLRDSGAGRFGRLQHADNRGTGGLVDGLGSRLERHAGDGDRGDQSGRQREDETGSVAAAGDACGVADAGREFIQQHEHAGVNAGSAEPAQREARKFKWSRSGDCNGCTDGATPQPEWPVRHPLFDRPRDPFWSDVDWLLCRDPDGPRLRPVESGSFPLATRHPGRNGELRAYGDAINLEVATAFLEAVRPEMMGEG